LRLTDLLSESRIIVPMKARSKRAVIDELVTALPLPEAFSRKELIEAIWDREHLMTTGIGNEIAIPHGYGRVSGGLLAALGIAPAPVEFEAVDGRGVRLVFLLVADEAAKADHLRALARISRLLHREAFRKSLAVCRSAAEALEIIREEERLHKI